VAILTLVGMIFPQVTFYVFFIPLLVSIAVIYFYSYLEYTKISKSSKSHH